MVFSLSSASSIRFASMKSLYLSGDAGGPKVRKQWKRIPAMQPHATRKGWESVWIHHSMMLHSTENKLIMVTPSVNRGSGSFRKKDFSRLLMTFRSCHLCRDTEGEVFNDFIHNRALKKLFWCWFLLFPLTPPQRCWCPGPCWDVPVGWTPWHCSLAHGRYRCTPGPLPQPHRSTSPRLEGQTTRREEKCGRGLIGSAQVVGETWS